MLSDTISTRNFAWPNSRLMKFNFLYKTQILFPARADLSSSSDLHVSLLVLSHFTNIRLGIVKVGFLRSPWTVRFLSKHLYSVNVVLSNY